MKQINLRIDPQDKGRATHQEDLSNIRIGGFSPAANSNDLTTLSQVTTLAGGDVFQSLSAQGTTNATTSIMSYGVNVFTTSTQTDFCTKLPQPVTGKRSTIVNMSTQAISVHPSNVGGKINNLPVDQPLVIPNDGKAYEFICTENPLPGEWNIIAPPAISQYQGVEIDVAHTNGGATNAYGYSTATITSSAGAGVSGGNLTLTGNWLSENQVATMTRLKVYTNILPADLDSDLAPDAISTAVLTAFLSDASTATSGQRITPFFYKAGNYEGSVSQIGTLNSPPLIGDTGTLYYELPLPLANQDGVYDQIGIGGQFSRAYYTFGMFIPSTAATKTYKFQFFLEYV
jgi:hypothetical protein